MTARPPDERVIDFVDRYLSSLSDGGDEPDINELPEALRSQALQQLRVLDELQPKPFAARPIEDDPIAKRFGFGRSDPTITISTAALKDAVQAASLKMSDLAQRLTDAGRPTGMTELFRLVRGPTATVDRDLAARFAAILDTSIVGLEIPTPARARSLDDFLTLKEARRLIGECAEGIGLAFNAVADRSRELLAARAFRNETDGAWMEALRAALDLIRREHGQ